MAYPVPPSGAPTRLTFVGQETYFRSAALTSPTNEIEPSFVDFRQGADAAAMLAELEGTRPQAIVVFRPELLPAGVLADVRAPIVGFLTEPLPRGRGREVHPDLKLRLSVTAQVDRSNFDRLVSFDPLFAETAERLAPVWRSFPLPVDDSHFRDVPEQANEPPRVAFLGRSTEHRERFLIPVKHRFDVLHIAHGLHGDPLVGLLAELDAGINLHNEPYPSFENRVCLHLAAGNLVISEPLSPTHGLEPGIDFVEVDTPEGLEQVVEELHRDPGAHHAERVRGRAKAEAFRASKVYPRLLNDLRADLDAFGTERAAA